MAELALHIDGAEEAAFRVLRFVLDEHISAPFSLSIVAGSLLPDLDLEGLVLRPAVFSLDAGWAHVLGGGRRVYTGVCAAVEQLSVEPQGLSLYALRLVPRLSLLALRRDYRIFQQLTIPAILARLLEGFVVPATFALDARAFPVVDYKVQYAETDLAFFCRLCEEAGITFTLRDGDHSSVVVLSEAPTEASPRQGSPLPFVDNPAHAAEREYVTRVRLAREARALSIALRDFDFRHPALPLDSGAREPGDASSLLEHFHFDPGAFRVVSTAPSATPIADLRGTARHEPHAGERRAEHLLAGERVAAHGVTFETDALDLAPGAVFSIAGHPHPSLDETRRLLVTELSIRGERDKEWTAHGKAVFANRPYRPPRRTPRPVVHGLQSAIVTGPTGNELFTDEHGRVRVRFLWDRGTEGDAQSSCWIRVSQGWAGAGYGLWTLPRVGQEVLVSFLEGNPDEPVIIGQLPNAHNPPPYALPAHATRAVWRSRSTPSAEGFNEISFEDRAGAERFFERAQRDKETLVLRDESLSVGGHRRHGVGGDEDITIGGTVRERIGGNLHSTVLGERRDRIGAAHSAMVGGDRQEQIGGRWAVQADGAIHLVSDQAIVIEAPDVTLKGAGGFVRVGAGGVTTTGGWPVIQPGAPGAGAGSEPTAPELPGGVDLPVERPRVRLPLLGFPGLPMAPAVDSERLVICEAICSCKDVRASSPGKGPRPSDCVTDRLRAYDHALGNQSTIKADVPYDMSQNPPVPIMSRYQPTRPTTSKPGGSKAPDVVLLKDPTKPPTQDNIKKIIEIKFPDDRWRKGQREAYDKIAGSAPVETWTPDTCGCEDEEKERKPVPAPSLWEIAVVGFLALLILGLILDDAVGGEADDALIPELVRELARRLGPIVNPALRPPPVSVP